MAAPKVRVRIHEAELERMRRLAAAGQDGWLIGHNANTGRGTPGSAPPPPPAQDPIAVACAVSRVRLSVAASSTADMRAEAADLRRTFPRGFAVVGAFFLGADEEGGAKEEGGGEGERGDGAGAGGVEAGLGADRNTLVRKAEGALQLAAEIRAAELGEKVPFPEEDGLVVFFFDSSGNRAPTQRLFVSKGVLMGAREIDSLEVVPGGAREFSREHWARHALVRCQLAAALPVYVAGDTPDDDDFNRALTGAISELQQDLMAPHTAYLVEPPLGRAGGPYLVQPGLNLDPGPRARLPPGQRALEDEPRETIKCEEVNSELATVTTAWDCQFPVPAQVSVFLRARAAKNLAPVLQYRPASTRVGVRTLHLSVDVLVSVPKARSLEEAMRGLVIPAISEQLQGMRSLAAQEVAGDIKLRAFHFSPRGIALPITAVYPLSYGESESRPVEIRKALHRRLGLPLDRPMLRCASAFSFSPEVSTTSTRAVTGNKRLMDVHVAPPLGPSGVVGGQQSLIEGSYEYYHYMQDRIDDNGWGCAYRSLQTIVSWFRLQSYTAVAIPSHRRIQETLVEIGDKEPKFVGSSQWIGAIELGYVLDQLLGVTCKVLTVQSGREMPTQGRYLARHFQIQGTPVMIGGGVLAYTLLGVDYNEQTGDCAFLILDPHYTGGEDIKSIRSGGWVGWKKAVTDSGQDFFTRDAFYNLLLPQRPETV